MEGKRAQGTGGASHLTLQLVSITQAPQLQNIEISVGKTPLFFEVFSFNTLLFVAQVNGFPLPFYELF